MTPQNEWQNFYEIVGSAAGALTGLQFVVMALMANLPAMESEPQAVSAFSTPSIVNFGVALFIAAVEVMPFHSLTPLSVIWAAAGVLGIIYTLLTGWRFQKQSAYDPVFEDWFYRIILPVIGYSALAAAFFVARNHPRAALFQVAGVVLLLLFVGIHDAWDNATYLVMFKRGEKNER
jgi:di/tricarboxylate transporter